MHYLTVPAPATCLVWRIDLDRDPPLEGLALLSDDEWARARRFAFERDRRRYLAAHAALRQLLARHCDRPGAALSFGSGAHGKPLLIGEDQPVHFNLTHSGAIALVTVHPHAEVGVDCEVLREMPDAAQLADAHFTTGEREALARLHGAARDRAFLTCWTRKEACLKAIGIGLGLDTRSFHVGIDAAPCEVTMPASAGAARLALSSFDLDGSGVGALAISAAPPCSAPPDWRAAPRHTPAAALHARERHTSELHTLDLHAPNLHASDLHVAPVRATELRA